MVNNWNWNWDEAEEGNVDGDWDWAWVSQSLCVCLSVCVCHCCAHFCCCCCCCWVRHFAGKQLVVLRTWQGYPGSCLVRNLATNFVEPFKLIGKSLQSLYSLPSTLPLLSYPLPSLYHLPSKLPLLFFPSQSSLLGCSPWCYSAWGPSHNHNNKPRHASPHHT